MNPDLFVKRVEDNVTILLQCRNLTGYAMATCTGHESQTLITQISQRLQASIGGLSQIIEEIRSSKPQPTQAERVPVNQVSVDTIMLIPFLTTAERADLGQLDHSYSELTIALDLVSQFHQRIIDLGFLRQRAGDRRVD